MRKLFILILASYLSVFTVPTLAMAAGEDLITACPWAYYPLTVDTSIADSNNNGTNNDEMKADEEAQIKMYEESRSAADESVAAAYSESTCGIPNEYTTYLEKGDCSAAGKVVTEISEVIAPDTIIEEGQKSESKVVTVYAGICCSLQREDQNGNILGCDESLTFYTDTFDKCTDDLQNCEKRQWVIGSSGIGIIKLMVKQIFTFGVLTVGSIAVVIIVYQGIKISVSGVSGDITESKKVILQSIMGLILLFLSGLILYTINPSFFGS